MFPARAEANPEMEAWVAIAVAGDNQWKALCTVMGQPTLASDERFASFDARKQHEDQLDSIIREWTTPQDKWAVAERLQSAGVAAAAVEHLKDMMETDPQLPHHYQQVRQPVAPAVDIPIDREAAQWVGSRLDLRRAPMLGEHNQYVIQDILGRSDEQFAQLIADEVVS